MKLSQYARKLGVNYKTVWLWYKHGQLKGYQLPTGTIIIEDEKELPANNGLDADYNASLNILMRFLESGAYSPCECSL
jgi:hypothetical protein